MLNLSLFRGLQMGFYMELPIFGGPQSLKSPTEGEAATWKQFGWIPGLRFVTLMFRSLGLILLGERVSIANNLKR